jgi:hypothetical protein
MVRGGSSPGRRTTPAALAGAAAALLLVAACGGGGDEDAAPSTTGGPVTVPEDAEAGLGFLVLDGDPTLLQVRSCTFEPVTDPATGVTTELAIDLDDSVAIAVSLTRSSFPGDLPTTTDEVLIARDGALAFEAERADRSGTIIDIREPGAIAPLITVDDGLVTASGVFGPVGARAGDEGLVEGSLTLRCP